MGLSGTGGICGIRSQPPRMKDNTNTIMNDMITGKVCRELRHDMTDRLQGRIEKMDDNIDKLHDKIDTFMGKTYDRFTSKFTFKIVLSVLLTITSASFVFLGYLTYKTFDMSTTNTQLIYEMKNDIYEIKTTLNEYEFHITN